MINRRKQIGVGLIEVLVALLILAVGVLGFVALQYRAIEAASEGESRIQAINLARDIAEKVRVNREQIGNYATAISENTITLNPNCLNEFCSASEKAVFDASQANLSAQRMGMTVNMLICPGVENRRQCIYVAWGDTSATAADATNNEDVVDCTSVEGTYTSTSTCVVMELY